jgi:hypothetical protein
MRCFHYVVRMEQGGCGDKETVSDLAKCASLLISESDLSLQTWLSDVTRHEGCERGAVFHKD